MSFVELYFSTDGRIGLGTFWSKGVIPLMVIMGLANMVDVSAQADGTLLLLVSLMVFWPAIALQVKRWHDRDKSGWWILIYVVPIIGSIWAFVELCMLAGTPGRNGFGLGENSRGDIYSSSHLDSPIYKNRSNSDEAAWPLNKATTVNVPYSAPTLSVFDVMMMAKRRDIDSLIRALQYQSDTAIRAEAAESLGHLDNLKAVEPLMTMLSIDSDPYVRSVAATALGDLGDARAVDTLRRAFDSDTLEVGAVAGKALSKLKANGW